MAAGSRVKKIGKSEPNDEEVAEALMYIESLLRALRGRLAAKRGVPRALSPLAADTRFPARSCRAVADAIAGTADAGAEPK